MYQKRILPCLLGLAACFSPLGMYAAPFESPSSYSLTESGFNTTDAELDSLSLDQHSTYTHASLAAWRRAPGPLRIGLQSGHLESENAPAEQPGLRKNRTGAKYKKILERNVNLTVARLAKEMLEKKGYAVDIIPTTVPPGYSADAFVSIHADGNPNPTKRGFKVASPRRDYSQLSHTLETSLRAGFSNVTQLPEDTAVTTNMRGYYAFNWQRFVHAVHPYTPSAIIEIGFLTNAADRAVVVDDPATTARGIVDGIDAFFSAQKNNVLTKYTPKLPTSSVVGKPICLNDHLNGNIRTPQCVYGIETKKAEQFALSARDADRYKKKLQTASAVTILGLFSPISDKKNTKWYPYDVDGVVEVREIR
jgi:hypothetical protein